MFTGDSAESNPRLSSGYPEAIQIAEHQSFKKMSDSSVTNRKLDQVSKPECSLQPLTTMPQPGNPNVVLHFYDKRFLTLDAWTRRTLPFNNLRTTDLRFTSQAFGR